MKLIETLSESELNDILKGKSVTFFKALQQFYLDIPFSDMLPNMCQEYYLSWSGEKQVSMLYERVVSNDMGVSKISDLLYDKYITKWKKVFIALIESEYSPLDDYSETETKQGSNNDTVTYNTTEKNMSTDTDTVTYNTTEKNKSDDTDKITYNVNISDDGKTSTKETVTRSSEDTDDSYGFNSSSPVGNTVSNGTETETTVGLGDDNTTHNTNVKTGTETKTIGIDGTKTKTGTETKTLGADGTKTKTGTDGKSGEYTETKTRSGRNTDGATLITRELSLRNRYNFFEMIYRDIDTVVTRPMYI